MFGWTNEPNQTKKKKNKKKARGDYVSFKPIIKA